MKTSFWRAKPAEILLEDDRFIINIGFFNNLLAGRYIRKYEICKIKLSDIKKGRDPNNKFEDTSAYKALNNDGENAYFKGLIQSLEKDGYDEKYMIVMDYDNVLLDGNHRRTWLYMKYGPDYEVNVLKIDKTAVPLFSKNMFIKLLCNLVPIKSMRKKLRQKYNIQHKSSAR